MENEKFADHIKIGNLYKLPTNWYSNVNGKIINRYEIILILEMGTTTISELFYIKILHRDQIYYWEMYSCMDVNKLIPIKIENENQS